MDINCDMGEGIGNEELIMPFINSANIACGYHAGDVGMMQHIIELCNKHHVAVGAHPSFFDRENFGRTKMWLPADDLYELITQQLIILNEVASYADQKLVHVKPHGALYNMSAKDALVASIVAKAVKDFDSNLVLFGLSGSHSVHEGKKAGLKTYNEVFADRTYQDDGTLTPRSEPGALITDTNRAVEQVLQIINEGTITTLSGKKIPVVADTICIHGDGKKATEFAKAIYNATQK